MKIFTVFIILSLSLFAQADDSIVGDWCINTTSGSTVMYSFEADGSLKTFVIFPDDRETIESTGNYSFEEDKVVYFQGKEVIGLNFYLERPGYAKESFSTFESISEDTMKMGRSLFTRCSEEQLSL